MMNFLRTFIEMGIDAIGGCELTGISHMTRKKPSDSSFAWILAFLMMFFKCPGLGMHGGRFRTI
jgi:hypothetical protein